MKNYALILAGGSGQRMKEETPKAFIILHGKQLIEYSIEEFSKHPDIHHIILVVPEDYISSSNTLIKDGKYSKLQIIIKGGATRFESCKNGIEAIRESEAKVLIHDAARPFLNAEIISNSIHKLEDFDALNLLSPVSDTIVKVDDDKIIGNLNREQIRLAQTPQSFKLSCIKKTHQQALKDDLKDITDDFNLVLKYQTGSCSWVEGNRMNFKITYPEDLRMAEKLMRP